MRWANGAPKKLYALVINKNGKVRTFERKEQRTAYVMGRTPTYPDGTYTFRTYVQQET